MKLYVCIICLAIFLFSCNDDSNGFHSGTITGFVSDITTHEPLGDVMISTNPPSQAVITSSTGEFTISDVVTGNYTMISERLGYRGKTINIRVNSGKTTRVDFLLSKSSDIGTKPNKSVLIFPEDRDYIRKDRITLLWRGSDPMGERLVYTVYLGKSTTSLEIIATDITDSSLYIRDLLDKTTYYWQVLAKNESGLTSVSDLFEFRYESSAPIKPNLIYPSDNSLVATSKINLIWECKDTNNLPISFNVHFGESTSTMKEIANNIYDTEYQILNLKNYTRYYWQISSKNSNGNETFSDIYEFVYDSANGVVYTGKDLLLEMTFNTSFNDISPKRFVSVANNVNLDFDRKNRSNFSLYFTGVDSYLKVSGSYNLNLSKDYTIAFWIKYNLSSIGVPIDNMVQLISKYGEGGYEGASYYIALTTDGRLNIGHYNDNNQTSSFNTSQSIPSNEWTHVCITFDQIDARVYFNTQLINQEYLPKPQFCDYNIYLGASFYEINSTRNRFFKGYLDDIYLYDRVLSENEIKELFER